MTTSGRSDPIASISRTIQRRWLRAKIPRHRRVGAQAIGPKRDKCQSRGFIRQWSPVAANLPGSLAPLARHACAQRTPSPRSSSKPAAARTESPPNQSADRQIWPHHAVPNERIASNRKSGDRAIPSRFQDRTTLAAGRCGNRHPATPSGGRYIRMVHHRTL
jgi:hypothetical protein